jgi:hypothetical protein
MANHDPPRARLRIIQLAEHMLGSLLGPAAAPVLDGTDAL